MRGSFVFVALTILVSSLAGLGHLSSRLAGASYPTIVKPLSSQVERGRSLYNFRCYFCHGYSGDARTLAATLLTPPPRNFKALSPAELPSDRIVDAILHGRSGTAMKSFANILLRRDAEDLAEFITSEFLARKAINTRYHTAANGWPGHSRYIEAYPFATGQIPLDRPWEELTPAQRQGKRLFLFSCITCHDRATVLDEGAVWDSRPLSYPRNQYQPGDPGVDAVSSASIYAIHDRKPDISGLDPRERKGEKLFQDNCAFCHAADGTGKNWIGRFMEPHPRDLTDPAFMRNTNRGKLLHTIREGLPNTSMPSWKSVLSDTDIDAVIAYINKAFHPVAESHPGQGGGGSAGR